MKARALGAAVAAACFAVSGCSSAPVVNENPTPAELDAYLVAFGRFLYAEAGQSPANDAEMLSKIDGPTRATAVGAAVDACVKLRDDPDQIAMRFTMEAVARANGDSQAADFEHANKILWLEVEHFCPSLRDRLAEISS